jgi:hypothetical protein
MSYWAIAFSIAGVWGLWSCASRLDDIRYELQRLNEEL